MNVHDALEYADELPDKKKRSFSEQVILKLAAEVRLLNSSLRTEKELVEIGNRRLQPLHDLLDNYQGQSGCDCLKIIRAAIR